MPKQGFVDIPFGVPPLPSPGTTRLGTDNTGNPIASIGGAAFAQIGSGGGGVQSVTGPAVNNADPANPKIVVPANWFGASLAFIQSQVPALISPVWTAEFTPNPGAPEIDIAT